jgi:hypothetical protein
LQRPRTLPAGFPEEAGDEPEQALRRSYGNSGS